MAACAAATRAPFQRTPNSAICGTGPEHVHVRSGTQGATCRRGTGKEGGLRRINGAANLGFVAKATLVVLGITGLAYVLWLGRDVLFVAFFAVLVASFLSVFVAPLERIGIRRPLAAFLVLLLFIGLLTVVLVASWPILQAQLGVARQQLPMALMGLAEWLEREYLEIVGGIAHPEVRLIEQVQTRLNRESAELIFGALPLLNSLAGALAGFLIVMFTGLFLAAEPRVYANGLARLFPRSTRRRVYEAMLAIGHMLPRWMLGTVISMSVIGVLIGTGLWLLKMPAAVVLGIVAGLFEFVPYFGPLLAALPAIAIALAISPGKALAVALLFGGVQLVESNLLHPVVMRGATKLPPALTLLFATFMAVLFGFLGLLLAVPILVTGKVLVEMLYVEEVSDEN